MKFIIKNNIRLNKELLYIIGIPDIIYDCNSLKKILIKKLTKNLIYDTYFIPIVLQTFLNYDNNYIKINDLIAIILKYSENTKPEYDYYSYDQKPNYKKN
jgi:hypothetical protein